MDKGKKRKKEKVQLNTRIFESQRNALRVLQIMWGYSSLDRTVREVLRRFFRLNRENKELQAQLNEMKARVQEAEGRNRELEGWARNAETARHFIEAFQEFKVEERGWDRDLARVEIKHLDDYIRYLQTGDIPSWSDERIDEEGLDDIEKDEE